MSTEFFGALPVNFHLFRIVNTFWVFSEKLKSLSALPFHIWLCHCLHILMCISYCVCMHEHKLSLLCFNLLLWFNFLYQEIVVLYCSQVVFSHYCCANNLKHSIILTCQWPEVMFILELKTLASIVTWTSFAKSSYLLSFSEEDGGRERTHVS